MLYLYEEYAQSCPNLKTNLLSGAIKSPKYLHEMTTDEIRELVKGAENTTRQKVGEFNRYFKWLSEQGKPTHEQLVVADFIGEKAAKEYIFDTDDFFTTWELFIEAIKRYSYVKNVSYNEDIITSVQVVCLLLWHGVSTDKIFDIKLSDVSENGILGYDLDLDKITLDIFMRYKNMVGMNIQRGINEELSFQKFQQDTFIRSSGKEKINYQYIADRRARNCCVLDTDEWIRTLFSYGYLYDNGIWHRIYNRIHSGDTKNFADIAIEEGRINTTQRMMEEYQRKYKKYAKARDEYEKIKTEIKSKPDTVDTQDSIDDVELLEILKEDQPTVPAQADTHIVDTCLQVINDLKHQLESISVQLDNMEQALLELKK